MSYIETKNNKYNYYAKKINIQKTPLTIKKFIGKKNELNTKENFIKENINELTNIEYHKREIFFKKLYPKLYNKKPLEEMEYSNIILSNTIEYTKKENEFYLNFAKEFIFNSNNIEGSKIPKEKVIEILQKGDSKYSNLNEVKEVKNSINAIKYLKKEFNFNEKSIKKLYHILTNELKRENGQNYPKGFKKIDIIVGNSKTTKPNQVKIELKNLLKWYKENKKKIHPIELAFEFHLRYESIHPFADANGRTGRMIMNKILMQNYYNPIIIFKENKKTYFNAIEKAREGKTQKYFQLMIQQSLKSYKQMLKSLHN